MNCRFSTTYTTKEAAVAMAAQYAAQGVAMQPAYCAKCKRWHIVRCGAK